MWLINWLRGWDGRIMYALHLRDSFFQPTFMTCWRTRKSYKLREFVDEFFTKYE